MRLSDVAELVTRKKVVAFARAYRYKMHHASIYMPILMSQSRNTSVIQGVAKLTVAIREKVWGIFQRFSPVNILGSVITSTSKSSSSEPSISVSRLKR